VFATESESARSVVGSSGSLNQPRVLNADAAPSRASKPSAVSSRAAARAASKSK
jgi:hypothetical protein